MRRCEIYIVLIVLCIVAANNYAFALEEKMIDGIIVHDSGNPKLTDNFGSSAESVDDTRFWQFAKCMI